MPSEREPLYRRQTVREKCTHQQSDLPVVKPWFLQWLEREHPELLSSYRGLYPGAAAEAPKGYRQWLAKRVRPLIRAHGLQMRHEEQQTRPARARPQAPRTAETRPEAPTLF